MVGTRKFVVALAATLACAGGCKKSDPLYCDEDTPCTAGYEACDLTAACTELRNTCLPPEDVCWDAAVGNADAGCLDSQGCPDDLPICEGACRACGTPEECMARAGSTPYCRGDGRCVECRDSNDCSDSAAPYCGTAGVCGQCETGADCQEIDLQLTFCTPEGTCLQCEPDAFLRCEGDDAVACNPTGTGEAVSTCSFGCNPGAGRCNECTPSTSTCLADQTTVCGADGLIALTETCLLGCHTNGTRCNDLAPANALGSYLDQTSTAPAVVLTNGATINTETGVVMNGDSSSVAIPSALLNAPSNGVQVRVFMVASLVVEAGEVGIQGGPAIAIVSDGDVSIGGRFNVSGRGSSHGSGALIAAPPCGAGNGVFTTDTDDYMSGKGGGGFGGAGGRGGQVSYFDGMNTFTETWQNGGTANGTTTLTPLRGGCAGGGGSPFGPAGGAVQISSRTLITISGSGYIDATGGGGPPGVVGNAKAGAGGGSGGGILLEAPSVSITASASLTANGGGGGCAIGTGGNGLAVSDQASGATCPATDEGNGGLGGSINGPATDGEAASGISSSGGGGGGGVGRIRINAVNINAPGLVTPAASTGTPAIR